MASFVSQQPQTRHLMAKNHRPMVLSRRLTARNPQLTTNSLPRVNNPLMGNSLRQMEHNLHLPKVNRHQSRASNHRQTRARLRHHRQIPASRRSRLYPAR